MRRPARHRPEGQGIARTCLESELWQLLGELLSKAQCSIVEEGHGGRQEHTAHATCT